MTTSHHDRVLKVADLIDAPGTSRRVEIAMPAPEGFELPLVTLSDPVVFTGVVESVVEGLLVRGDLAVDAAMSCARCLEPVHDRVSTEIVELFHDPERTPAEDLIEADDGYDIRDGHIDLDALLRDNLAPSIPAKPLCREDCQGLCASCGGNRNMTSCTCAETHDDPRWAMLESLRLPTAGDDTGPQTS